MIKLSHKDGVLSAKALSGMITGIKRNHNMINFKVFVATDAADHGKLLKSEIALYT